MKYAPFNLNDYIKVKLTDLGIEHYVRAHNNIMPFKYHISFNEFKNRADPEGYHSFQMHTFLADFGGMGLALSNLVEANALIQINEPTF